MPLVRFEVKNEFGLADPELYRNKEDPKAILDGVAVAGLVGILRQLGDLAEFAADVFDDLHEQVMFTAGRGTKMLSQLQRIESALPAVEKAVHGQRSHIHFAYVAGSVWHANVRTERSLLLHSDLPQFIIDSYEESREPPCLHLLDRFDSAGAGACLKRYSDPSYFKRVLTSSESVKVEKNKRNKKKRSRLRNVEVLNPHDSSSSTQSTSANTDQLSFSVEDESMFDTRSKPELLRKSTSFDSETRMNNVEQVSSTLSIVLDELECEVLLSSPSYVSHSMNCDFLLHKGQNGDCPTDDSQHGSQKQQRVPSSSSVTWDENNELVKPTSPVLCDETLVDTVQDLESLALNTKPSNIEYNTSTLGILDDEDIVSNISKVPQSSSGRNQFNDVTSEAENYMDASNTLDYEIETDPQCQTKREVKSPSSLSHGDLETGNSKIQEQMSTSLNCFDAHAPNVPNSYSSPIVSNLDSLEGFHHVQQSILATDFFPKPEYSVVNDHSNCNIPMGSRCGSESPRGDLCSESNNTNEQAASLVETTTKTSNFQVPPTNASDVPSVRFWTNGGILGVEPSKPPVFSIQNDGTITSLEKEVMCNKSISWNSCSEEERKKSEDNIPVSQNLQEVIQAPLLGELDRNQDAPFDRTGVHVDRPDQESNDIAAPGSAMSVSYNSGSESDGSCQNTIGVSASLSALAHRFLSNGLQKRVTDSHADTSMPCPILNTRFSGPQETSQHNEHKELPNGFRSHTLHKTDTKGKIEVGLSPKPVSSRSPNSGSSSPPLGHMKIAFHPMNGLETSTLKLEFSNNLYESNDNLMFPSFQLMPVPFVPLLDSGSETDDIFCRSYPYSSEDHLSPHSEPDSEFWGEDERSRHQKQVESDDMCRVSSSTTSICSSSKFEQMDYHSIDSVAEFENLDAKNDMLAFQSHPTDDFPGVDSMISSKTQELDMCDTLTIDAINSIPQLPNDLPPLPPLPPMEWRVMKLVDFASVEQDDSSGVNNVAQLTCLQGQSFVAYQQPKQDCCPTPCNADSSMLPYDAMHDQQKLDGHRDLETFITNGMDEREELLCQIRSRSFNLKRTVIVKPVYTPESATSANVAATLEKADVIRQAFLGDKKGREDDNWSEG